MGGIIRAGRDVQRQGDVNPVAFNLADVKQQADEYLRQVKKQANQLIEQAKQEAEQVRQTAQRTGEAEARKQVEQSLEKMVSSQLQQLTPTLTVEFERLAKRRDEWIHEWEQHAIQLAVRIAERVIQRELSVTPDIPIELVREALDVIAGARRCEIRLNPKDYELLESQLSELTRGPARVMEVNTIADPSIPPGGCEILTDQGEVDQRLETRLKRIETELLAD